MRALAVPLVDLSVTRTRSILHGPFRGRIPALLRWRRSLILTSKWVKYFTLMRAGPDCENPARDGFPRQHTNAELSAGLRARDRPAARRRGRLRRQPRRPGRRNQVRHQQTRVSRPRDRNPDAGRRGGDLLPRLVAALP